jgi:hypothetical protein
MGLSDTWSAFLGLQPLVSWWVACWSGRQLFWEHKRIVELRRSAASMVLRFHMWGLPALSTAQTGFCVVSLSRQVHVGFWPSLNIDEGAQADLQQWKTA